MSLKSINQIKSRDDLDIQLVALECHMTIQKLFLDLNFLCPYNSGDIVCEPTKEQWSLVAINSPLIN